MQTIACHDCENQVSFSAVACPHCGSSEPSGPYRFSAQQARRIGAEDKNDRTLVVSCIIFGLLGALYGALTSSGGWSEIVRVPTFALIGTTIAFPAVMLANVLRRMRSFRR